MRKRAIVSFGLALLCYGVGTSMYAIFSCFGFRRDCAVYSPIGIFIGKLLCGPMFFLEAIVNGRGHFVATWNPVVLRVGLVALWLYYYCLLWVVEQIRMFRNSGRRGG
jgi:hypothetical protein